MLKNLNLNKTLWYIVVSLTLLAAVFGVLNPRMYDRVFAPEFIPGALPQDILTIMLCVATFVLIAKTSENDTKKQITVIGIIGSFFYLYGIFTIERVYNWAYPLYLSIFAASFWSLVVSLGTLNHDKLRHIHAPSLIVKIAAGIGLSIATLFTLLWLSALVPLMRDQNRIEFLYSIYILDLCIVMPAFFITSILSFKKQGLGLALLPAVFIVGFFVIFPLGLGEVAKPFYGQSANIPSIVMSFSFSILMVALGATQLKSLKVSQ